MDRDLMHLRDSLIPRYAELIYYGFWYAPEREALQALIDQSQQKVSRCVRLKLYKGNVLTVGRKSAFSLYDPRWLPWRRRKSITNLKMREVLSAEWLSA